ncbi:MAG: O-antigen ligase family protein, partial [Acetobacteraceae bacterium]
AAGTFPHPILLGIACCFGVTLSSALHGGKRVFALTGGIVGLVASVSSAPLMGLLVVAGCYAYRKLTEGFEGRWRMFIAIWATLIAAFAFASNHPVGYLISHLALDPATGFYRLLIWQYAGSAVMDSPLVGIGLTLDWARPDWMPETVDSLWLRAAMTYGIPGSIMIALCLLAACARPTDMKRANLSRAGHQLGLALSLIMSLCLYLGFTVYFWSSVWILMSLFIGMRTSIGVIAGRPRELPRAVRYADPAQLGLTGIRQSVHGAP